MLPHSFEHISCVLLSAFQFLFLLILVLILVILANGHQLDRKAFCTHVPAVRPCELGKLDYALISKICNYYFKSLCLMPCFSSIHLLPISFFKTNAKKWPPCNKVTACDSFFKRKIRKLCKILPELCNIFTLSPFYFYHLNLFATISIKMDEFDLPAAGGYFSWSRVPVGKGMSRFDFFYPSVNENLNLKHLTDYTSIHLSNSKTKFKSPKIVKSMINFNRENRVHY